MSRRLAVLALACLAVLGAGVGSVGGQADVLAAETPTNETVHHENPEEASGEGSLEDVRGWLLGRLSDRLGRSTVEISNGQYEAARGLLGNETRELLGKFVDVAEETGSEADDETADALNETVETQREFVASVSNYSSTYEAYLAAREAGNTSRARRLARRLLETGEQVNETGSALQRDYGRVGNATGTDTTGSRRAVENRTENVTATLAEIRSSLFLETEVVVTAASRSASFAEPLVVEGRVRGANGTAISAGHVAIRDPAGDATARVGEGGSFALRYRPVALAANAERVFVLYRPPTDSPYLGANASVPLSVSAVESTVEVSGAPGEVSDGANGSVRATVTAAGRAVDGVPVVARLGGERLARARTANGTATLSFSVPASVDDGERELRVAVAMEDRAVRASSASRTVRVRETATDLTIRARQLGDGRLRVTGELTTRDGAPLSGRVVDVSIGGESVGGDLTDENGSISTVLAVPEGVGLLRGGNLTVAVSGAFRPSGANLASATGETRLVLGPARGGTLGFGFPAWAWAALLGLVVVVAVVTYRVLSGGDGDGPAVAPGESREAGAAAGEASSVDVGPLLALARERLEGGTPDDAVEAGYEAARRALSARFGVSGNTHWEFYRAGVDAGVREELLRRLTEHYERAAFAPGTLSVDAAREALGLVEVLERGGSVESGDD